MRARVIDRRLNIIGPFQRAEDSGSLRQPDAQTEQFGQKYTPTDSCMWGCHQNLFSVLAVSATLDAWINFDARTKCGGDCARLNVATF